MRPRGVIALLAVATAVYGGAQTQVEPPDGAMLRLAQRMTVEAPPKVAEEIRHKSLTPFFKAL